VIDSLTPAFGSNGRAYRAAWVAAKQRLVIASQREVGGPDFDILAMKVTRSAIKPEIDTIASGLEMVHGAFNVSPDGERLIYASGHFESALWMVDHRQAKGGRFVATQARPTATTRSKALISPRGDEIVVVSEIPTPSGRASDISILPRDGGAERPIARGVMNLLDFSWSLDGGTVLYLQGVAGNQVRLMEGDMMGRPAREIVRLAQSSAVAFHPLPDGAFCVLPQGRRSVSLIRRRGKGDTTWPAPDWIREIWSVSLSPDATSLAVMAPDARYDSMVVATMDVESGVFEKVGSYDGEWLGRVHWLQDDSIMFDILELQGAWAVFTTTRRGSPTRRLGALPSGDATVSVSNDGRHMIASTISVKNDLYMIRNFGKMLR